MVGLWTVIRVNNALGCCSSANKIDCVSSSANNLTRGLYGLGWISNVLSWRAGKALVTKVYPVTKISVNLSCIGIIDWASGPYKFLAFPVRYRISPVLKEMNVREASGVASTFPKEVIIRLPKFFFLVSKRSIS
jgi:hypothetical protein